MLAGWLVFHPFIFIRASFRRKCLVSWFVFGLVGTSLIMFKLDIAYLRVVRDLYEHMSLLMLMIDCFVFIGCSDRLFKYYSRV